MENMLEDKSVEGAWKRYGFATGREGVTVKDVMDLYDKWAEMYEQDAKLVGALDEDGCRKRIEVFAKLGTPNEDAKILDLCAGTGLHAVELKEIGFTNLDALDGSRGMLKVAERKGIYRKLIHHVLGADRIPVDDNSYDGVVCAFSLHPGHVEDGACFPELARIVRSGGKIILLSDNNQLHRYKSTLEQMASAGVWKYNICHMSMSMRGVEFKNDVIEITLV